MSLANVTSCVGALLSATAVCAEMNKFIKRLSYASDSLCQTLHQAYNACISVLIPIAGASMACTRPSVSAQQHHSQRTASHASLCISSIHPHRLHSCNKPTYSFLHQLFVLRQLTDTCHSGCRQDVPCAGGGGSTHFGHQTGQHIWHRL